MKERRLKYIIIISTLSILGLIFIQAYWVKNAIEIKESSFEQTVNKAIGKVVKRISLPTNSENIAFRQQKYLEGLILTRQLDSLSRLINDNELNEPGKITEYYHGQQLVDGYQYVLPFRNDTAVVNPLPDSIQRHSGKPGDRITHDNDKTSEKLNMPDDKSSVDITEVKKNYQELSEQLNNTLKAITQGANTKSPTPDSLFLDSIIRFELNQEKIFLRFFFGIYYPADDILIMADSVRHKEKLLSSGFAFNLFSGNQSTDNAYLLLYFPNQKNYLIKQTGHVLMVSVLLLTLLIFSLYYITRSILRQKRLSEMKNDFINNMTHEFKTPVSTISLACQALTDDDIEKTPAMLNTYIGMIEQENKRLGKLAENILQSALIEKAAINIRPEKLNIREITKDVAANFEMKVKQKEGEITIIDKLSETEMVADRTHLRNLLSNLIDNAIKYTPANPLIVIELEQQDHQLVINV
ncbi:MAG: HAMP domain-containing sensor histidine kinase, partial [Bacteroidales bacterium]|nr:HAMP domain-containing sensor histidine kinase [Bacteroidales bacterium]